LVWVPNSIPIAQYLHPNRVNLTDAIIAVVGDMRIHNEVE
jgi:hypothetical protein